MDTEALEKSFSWSVEAIRIDSKRSDTWKSERVLCVARWALSLYWRQLKEAHRREGKCKSCRQ